MLARATSAGFAALLERVFVQKLFDAPRLVLLIGSIGIAQVAFGLGSVELPHWVPFDNPFVLKLGSDTFPVPFEHGWTIGSVGLSSAQVLTLVAAPAIVIALQLLFTRTELGRTIRAADWRSSRWSFTNGATSDGCRRHRASGRRRSAPRPVHGASKSTRS